MTRVEGLPWQLVCTCCGEPIRVGIRRNPLTGCKELAVVYRVSSGWLPAGWCMACHHSYSQAELRRLVGGEWWQETA
jgi:hypothetical protein